MELTSTIEWFNLCQSIDSSFGHLMNPNPITVDPDVLGGTPVFRGTRVPVQSLFDFLEAGDSIEEFLENFPTVHREQVIELLQSAREKVMASRESA